MENLANKIFELSDGDRKVAILLIKICKELPVEEVVDFFDCLEIYEIKGIHIWIRYEQQNRDIYQFVNSLKK